MYSGIVVHDRLAVDFLRKLENPDGHFKIPHLWPGQNPPGDSRRIAY